MGSIMSNRLRLFGGAGEHEQGMKALGEARPVYE
jgi:hypothetical protein